MEAILILDNAPSGSPRQILCHNHLARGCAEKWGELPRLDNHAAQIQTIDPSTARCSTPDQVYEIDLDSRNTSAYSRTK
jgi:hypothetical protein